MRGKLPVVNAGMCCGSGEFNQQDAMFGPSLLEIQVDASNYRQCTLIIMSGSLGPYVIVRVRRGNCG